MSHTPASKSRCDACGAAFNGCPLHAAAPELVAALTNLVNQFHPRDGSRLWWATVGPSLVVYARDVLARVKGE